MSCLFSWDVLEVTTSVLDSAGATHARAGTQGKPVRFPGVMAIATLARGKAGAYRAEQAQLASSLLNGSLCLG